MTDTLDTRPRVLFLCTHNSARSQMAEGLLRHYAANQVVVQSAGSDPRPVHPVAVAVLAEMGIDISQQQSKHLETMRGQSFDYVITICDDIYEQCPDYPGNPIRLHWGLPDPSATPPESIEQRIAFQQVARLLVEHIRTLLVMIPHRHSVA
ncbi:MAG: arsenate reductase ArsC [Chloroflexaceae bacterium]|nr:arsenate reductase ArsC [Chloroflexaceae bacterium]